MASLTLERRFDVPQDRLFRTITTRRSLLQWWGPEGMHVPEGDLDFSRTGPWDSVMVNAEGLRLKVSGHVTHVDKPNSVGFTWGWHDENDKRGEESHVIFRVTPEGKDASRLVVEHVELPAGEQAENHERGWTSSLRKLETLLAQA